MRYLTIPILAAATVLGTGSAHADFGDELFKLLPNDGAQGEWFGRTVAISGTTAIVGKMYDDNGTNIGSAYLFDAITGQQLFKLEANDGVAEDFFGRSVAISGTIAIVGAYGNDDKGDRSGSAYLFDTITGEQIFKLLPNDGEADDLFGFSVAISGNIALIGAIWDADNGNHAGSAYLFDTITGQQLFKLLPEDGAAEDRFGESVAISGDTVIIGVENHEDNGTFGSAYLFDATTGAQIGKLLPEESENAEFFGGFGGAVGISGNTAIVGAAGTSDNGYLSGSAYIFDTTTFQQLYKLLPDDGADENYFGISVAISGDTAIVGANYGGDNGIESGSAYIFDAVTGMQIAEFIPEDITSGHQFGYSVAISDAPEIAIIGAVYGSDNGSASGSAYLFDSHIPGTGGNLFVDDDAAPGGDGKSWNTAYRFLQDAIEVAAGGGVDEIRVAQGLYKPDQNEANPNGTGNRETRFQMLNGLAIVGGYAGIGTENPDARDYDLFKTIISGDIGVIDLVEDNSYHVISASGTNQTVVLDGLIITEGYASGASPNHRGGGMIIDNGIASVFNCTFLDNTSRALTGLVTAGGAIASSSSNLILTNCSFIHNKANGNTGPNSFLGGGAIATSNSTITGSNCRFVSNGVVTTGDGSAQGGAMRIVNSSVITLSDCWFISNLATKAKEPDVPGTGGGMYIRQSTVSLTNCILVSNKLPGNFGGGAGAGIYAQESDVALMNCLLSGQYAQFSDFGAGIYATAGSNISVTNSTLADNSQGGIQLTDGSDLFADNTILWGNGGQIDLGKTSSATINYCDIQGWTGQLGGTGNIGDDPLFVGGPTGTWTEDSTSGPIPGESVYIDSNASFTAGEFVGNTIITNTSIALRTHRFIVANTSTTITVLGSTPGVGAGNRYEILNYRLQPGSPCIDAADNTALPLNINNDLDGNPRYVDDPETADSGIGNPPVVDMGSYEFQALICPWDLNGDGAVGTSDLLVLFGFWGTDPGEPPDFNEDGIVNTSDLLILFANWGPCE